MNIKHIIKGWLKGLKLISSSDSEKALSDLRLKVCKKCELSKPSRILSIINGQARYEDQLQCTKCGCPCLEKSLVANEHCPINKW